MTDTTTETWPDLPPITDERGYQCALVYIKGLEMRGVTEDPRHEHAPLLRQLRRACELYEKTMIPARVEMGLPPTGPLPWDARTLVTKDCDCGACGECRMRAERDQYIATLTTEWSAHAMTRAELKASRAAHEQAIKERDEAKRLVDEAAPMLLRAAQEKNDLIAQLTRWQTDLAFARSQRDDNENAWQCEKAKRLAHEITIALLQRRLAHRNLALKELSKGAIDFTGARAQPEDAAHTYFYLLARANGNAATHYEQQLREQRRAYKRALALADRLQRQNDKARVRLHLKRAEARHWERVQTAALAEDLLAERAAREQAEKDHGEAQNRLYFVERERDAALARVKELEQERDDAIKACDDNWVTHQQIVAAETALASARELLETCWNERRAPLYAELKAVGMVRYEISCGQMLPVISSHLAPVAEDEEPRHGRCEPCGELPHAGPCKAPVAALACSAEGDIECAAKRVLAILKGLKGEP